jgi:hypothetical protein
MEGLNMFGTKKILAEIEQLKIDMYKMPDKIDLLEMMRGLGRVGPITHRWYATGPSGEEIIRESREYVDFGTIGISYPSGGRF